jgi:hypothetical protein
MSITQEKSMHAGRFESSQAGRDAVVLRGPRMIRDITNGEVITVVERRADGITAARAPACLVFSTDRGFTRLWNYPANWIDLTDTELRALAEFRRVRSA